MTSTKRQLAKSEYSIGWIVALSHERTAARAMLDESHAGLAPGEKHESDDNSYDLGSINGHNGVHNIVIVGLAAGRDGKVSAGTTATKMLSTFPTIKIGLLVGIGGGIPNEDKDIRLGDVVVSKPEGRLPGVRQYDLGRFTSRGFQEKGHLSAPPGILLKAIAKIQSDYELDGSTIPTILEEMGKKYRALVNQEPGKGYIYQGRERDRLFRTNFVHPAGRKKCDQCPGENEVERSERLDDNPEVHYGTIASGGKQCPSTNTK